MKVNKIVLHGEVSAAPDKSSTETLRCDATYIVSGANRDVVAPVIINLDANNIAQFIFEDDSFKRDGNTVIAPVTWFCDSSSIHELFPEAILAKRDGEAFVIPTTLKSASDDRGIIGNLVLKAVKLFTKKTIAVSIKGLAEKLELGQIGKKSADGKDVYNEGLFKVNADFSLTAFDGKASAKPFLLFIHGTNSSTFGAYADLRNSETWKFMLAEYGDNIIGFQHRTLTESPLQNTVKLVNQLPDNAELHIISHSRGGLIGDILCRYSKTKINNGGAGFSKTHLALLKNETGRDTDVDCIKQLSNSFLKKKLYVSKFVRVACPAAGTRLASSRMEHLLNTFFNLFGGDLNPLADTLKSLIGEVIKTKDNLQTLPGLEAMNPDSPFLKILNDKTPEESIDDTSLIVISGNSKPSISLKGLATILVRLFFSQRNDLVVNTDSMYLGCSRKSPIQYFFAEGTEVNHVEYFANNKTREALLLALKTPAGTPIPGFSVVQQTEVPGSDRNLDRGLEHGELFPATPSGKKPIVVLLPGIMGSNLGRNGKLSWINYWQFLTGGLLDLEDVLDNSVEATSVVSTSYKKLATRLSFNYDVVVFPFDWRRQLNECASLLNHKLLELMDLKQPIKLIGHSMGGVLVRDFIITHPDTWQKLNSSKNFSLIFLGSPLGGSFRIPAVLFGYDSIINTLAAVDQKHNKKTLLTMFSAFPGILSLLPLTKDADKDFAQKATWEKMRDAFGDSSWPIPGETILKEFKDYRDGILAGENSIDYSNMIYVAGKDKLTPCDYYNDMIGPRTELVFLYTGEGDQSVTWESGIPKQLIAAERVYYADVTHGALANDASLFDGIEELLAKGQSNQLSKTRPVVRGEEKIFRAYVMPNFDTSERGVENAILGITEKQAPRASQVPVSVSVSNGDLTFASYPVMVGHFKNDGILYAERSIDKNVSARNRLEIYPGDIGSSDIFLNNANENSFRGALVVGLGEPGTLTAFLLTKTVELGIANYLLHIYNHPDYQHEIGISSLIIGCGYGGLSVDTSLRAIIEGVNNANRKVAELYQNNIKTVQFIEFIELYEDKALTSLYSLSSIESRDNQLYNIRMGNKKIKNLFGLKRRLLTDATDEWWNRISVKMKQASDKSNKPKSMVFGASTGDAREEEKELFSSTELIDVFLNEISTQNNWNSCSAKTIFELMIPNEFKDRLKRKGSISWVLDEYTAAYPWELLQDNSANAKPLCVNAGMIRQLATPNFRVNIKRVAGEKAFIVGDPNLNNFINQLAGAAREASAVGKIMSDNGYQNTSIINGSAEDIVRNLFCNDYKVIHLAGHGMYDPQSEKKSGMVIGDGIFLTTFDISQMSAIPELVFVNCCHLAKVNAVDEKYFQDRYKLAANIGTQLINMGVKAVIAAGWAVDDGAATDFAERFYSKMLTGSNFGDAVKDARNFIYEKYHNSNNTWGAYQCYGDPFYKLVNRSGWKKPTKLNYLLSQEAEIDLRNLLSDLDTTNVNTIDAMTKLKMMMEAVDVASIRNPDITEKEAFILSELCEYNAAIETLENLFGMEEAQFSVAALEKYCTVRARVSVIDHFDVKTKKRAAPLAMIESVIKDIEYLLLISPTVERYALLASAYKRKALFGTPAQKQKNLTTAAFYYYLSQSKAKNGCIRNLIQWYNLEAIIRMNNKKGWTKAETVNVNKQLFVHSDDKQLKSYQLPSMKQAKEYLEKLKTVTPDAYINTDYWTMIELSNVYLSELILNNAAQKGDKEKVLESFKSLWRKTGSAFKRKTEIENLFLLQHLIDTKGTLNTQLKELSDMLVAL